MRKNHLVLSVILVFMAVILIWITPVMAAEKTEFTCIETVLGPPAGGEVTTLPSGGIHFRGAVLLADEWANDPRLVGLNTIVFNANLDADLSGPMWGTFRIENYENEGNGWEGTYAGHRGDWYNAVAEGFGAYTGMKMWWHKTSDGCSGTILEH